MTTLYPILTELDDHPNKFYLFILMVNVRIKKTLMPYGNAVCGILKIMHLFHSSYPYSNNDKPFKKNAGHVSDERSPVKLMTVLINSLN